MSKEYHTDFSYGYNFMSKYTITYCKCDRCNKRSIDFKNWIKWITTENTHLDFCCLDCYNSYKKQIEDMNGETKRD